MEYNEFRRERAGLGEAYDDAIEEENRLGQMYSTAQERRLELGKRFDTLSTTASTKLLHTVLGVTELRDAIFLHLLPGEVLAFHRDSSIPVRKEEIVADLSPFRLVLAKCKRLQSMINDGYNLTLVSGTEEMLLYGLWKLNYRPWYSTRPKSRCWQAVLLATKGAEFVPCSPALLPLSEFGCAGRDADSLEDYVDESGASRSVTLRYGSDVMSIWMPLCEQSTSSPIAIPQSIFYGFVEKSFKAYSRYQPGIFYSHLGEEDARVRGPLEHTKHPHGKTREDISEAPLLSIEVSLKDQAYDRASVILYELGKSSEIQYSSEMII